MGHLRVVKEACNEQDLFFSPLCYLIDSLSTVKLGSVGMLLTISGMYYGVIFH